MQTALPLRLRLKLLMELLAHIAVCKLQSFNEYIRNVALYPQCVSTLLHGIRPLLGCQ
jgi:hypothetical protein